MWSHGHHSVTHLVHLLSFSHETCPAYQCLLVQIWWITSMTPAFEQIQLALFLSHSVSPIIICSIWHCGMLLFHIMESSLPKAVQPKAYSMSQLLFLIMIFCHHLSEVDAVVNIFDHPSIDVNVCFVNSRIAHDFSLSQVHIETYWFAGFMDVLYHLLQLWGWFSKQHYIICKDEVGQVFTINLDTSVFPVDLANDIIL